MMQAGRLTEEGPPRQVFASLAASDA
jgi:hypothetical protein